MGYSLEQGAGFAKEIMAKTKPTQTIGFKKLQVRFEGQLNQDQLYAGLRWLRHQGLASCTPRIGHKDGTLVQFYKEPIPKDERDKVPTKTFKGKKPYKRSAKSNGLFHEEAVVTFTVKGGTYTPQELRSLAVRVMRALGEG